MFIGIAALGFATVVAAGIRAILVHQNKKLECTELRLLTAAEEERIRDAARLEGISYEEALKRRRGFRYLL